MDNKLDELIAQYLKHITYIKPITARQCIQLLPIIAKHKPKLRDEILSALDSADLSLYKESMQALIFKDILKALKEIEGL